MVQNYKRLKLQIEELNSLNLTGGQIQKIYSSSRYIDLQVRLPGKTLHLFVGRGKSFEGIWYANRSIPAYLRARDHFLEYLRKHVTNKRIFSVELDEKDRIIKLALNKEAQESILLFYRGRELLFAHCLGGICFKSWTGSREEGQDSFELFDEIGRQDVQETEASSISEIEELLEVEQEFAKNIGEKEVRKLDKKLDKKISNIKMDLAKVANWQELVTLVDKEDLSLKKAKVTILGIRFHFKKDSHYARRSEVFDKIKNLKKVEQHLSDRLSEAEKKRQEKKAREQTSVKPIAPVWLKKQKSRVVKPLTAQGFKVKEFDSFDLGVGLTSQGNDQLRKWANKDDLWVHLDGSTSAHAIIKIKDSNCNQMEALEEAAKAIGSSSEIDIIYTKVRNLKSVKGAPGKVIYTKEKHVRIRL